jgi:N4-gp56 family major capsid protein
MALPTAASVITSGLAQQPSVYFNKMAISTLFSKLFGFQSTEQRPMPNQAGVVNQVFQVEPLAALTTAGAEGDLNGNGQALTETTKQITISNFSDFITISKVAQDTHIVEPLTEATKALAYRGALGIDNIVTTAYDSAANSSSSARLDIATGNYVTSAVSSQAASQLENNNVSPKESGYFMGLLHTNHKYDLVNSNASAGGTADLMKYTEGLAAKNPLLVGINPNGHLGVIGGVDWYVSAALPSEAGWQSGTHTAYHSYVVGFEAMIASSLGQARGFNQKNFQVFTRKYAPGDSSSDPAGRIAAAAAINYYLGVATAPGSTPRFVRIRAEGSKA